MSSVGDWDDVLASLASRDSWDTGIDRLALERHEKELKAQNQSLDLLRSVTAEYLSDSDAAASGPLSKPANLNFRVTSWWARLLKLHTQEMDVCHQQSLNVKTVMSACTGIFSEGEALRVPRLFKSPLCFGVESLQCFSLDIN